MNCLQPLLPSTDAMTLFPSAAPLISQCPRTLPHRGHVSDGDCQLHGGRREAHLHRMRRRHRTLFLAAHAPVCDHPAAHTLPGSGPSARARHQVGRWSLLVRKNTGRTECFTSHWLKTNFNLLEPILRSIKVLPQLKTHYKSGTLLLSTVSSASLSHFAHPSSYWDNITLGKLSEVAVGASRRIIR